MVICLVRWCMDGKTQRLERRLSQLVQQGHPDGTRRPHLRGEGFKSPSLEIHHIILLSKKSLINFQIKEVQIL